MDVLNQLFNTFKVSAQIFHNGQYCGKWAIDTSHSQYMSFHIVSHGRCFLSVDENSEVMTLNKGDMVLFPKNTPHCLTNDESFLQLKNTETSVDFDSGLRADGTGLICGYLEHNHPLMHSITQFVPQKICLLQAEMSNSTQLLVKALLAESITTGPSSELVMNRIVEALLAIIFRQHLPNERGVIAALQHPKLNKAIHAIHQNPEAKWTVSSLAEKCHMSRAGFSELFKTILQQSPIEYVTQWRISLAYRMLTDEKVTTLQAALACGYDNESSFSKAFKRVLGISPGSLRLPEITNNP